MDMGDSKSASRIKNLFISYHNLIRRQGIAWLLEDNEEISVQNVLSAIEQTKLGERLDSIQPYKIMKRLSRIFLIMIKESPRSFSWWIVEVLLKPAIELRINLTIKNMTRRSTIVI